MGVMHKVMSFFGLVAEEEVDRRKLSQGEFADYEGELFDDDVFPHSGSRPRGVHTQGHNVVSLKAVKQHSKLILVEPRTYDETQELADHLRQRRIVLTNLQRMNHEQAKRIVDFLSGTVYALGGDIQKVGPHIFLCTPDNVEVQGSITEMYADTESRMR